MIGLTSSWRQSYGLILVGTVAVVALADFFFYDHPVGWPAALVAATMLALLAARSTRFLTSTGGRLIALGALGLLLALIEQPTWLNICYILICLSILTLTNSLGWENQFTRWLRRFGLWLNHSWLSVFRDNGLVMRWLVRHGLPPGVARMFVAWTVPLLASSVFVALFALANPVISDFFSTLGTHIGNVLKRIPELFNIGRILFWIPFAIVAWMLLRGRVHRRRHLARHAGPSAIPVRVISTEPISKFPRQFSTALVIRCLLLFNLVFLVQNALDSRFLWIEGELPHRLEYREYVRRGAYPLVAAALLAGAFVLVTFRPGSETDRSSAARRLVYAWIGQTILLTVSAAWRLGRYIEMSELTRLRVASIIWFALVALGLMFVIWRIARHRTNGWLININAVVALLVLYPCCFVNFDGIIAEFNAHHCKEAGGRGSPLDLDYFQNLGPASVAALDAVRPVLTAPPRQQKAQEISHALHAELDGQLSDWRGWTWRRYRVAQALDEQQLARAPYRTRVAPLAAAVSESSNERVKP